MQATAIAEAIQIQQIQATPACATCAHPQDTHDAIALRYCAATLASAITRGCICKVTAATK